MNIPYDNSLYCAEPPKIIIPPLPDEEMDWKIMMRIDEENIENGFLDQEAEHIRELIKWEELKS